MCQLRNKPPATAARYIHRRTRRHRERPPAYGRPFSLDFPSRPPTSSPSPSVSKTKANIGPTHCFAGPLQLYTKQSITTLYRQSPGRKQREKQGTLSTRAAGRPKSYVNAATRGFSPERVAGPRRGLTSARIGEQEGASRPYRK